MSFVPAHPDRLTELLADRAVFGLDPEEEGELNRLLETTVDGPYDDEEFDRVAAAIDLALGVDSWQPLPDRLRAKIRADALRYLPRPLSSHQGDAEASPGV